MCGANRTTHWIWDCPRRSLLHNCHFDPGTLPVLEPGGEGEAEVLVTVISGSRWLLKVHPRVVSARGAGVDAVPLSEGAQGCLSVSECVSVAPFSQHYSPVPGPRGHRQRNPSWQSWLGHPLPAPLGLVRAESPESFPLKSTNKASANLCQMSPAHFPHPGRDLPRWVQGKGWAGGPVRDPGLAR